MPDPLTEEEQRRVRLLLDAVRSRVRVWRARYLSERDDLVEPGSSLAADNRLTDPYLISQLAYNYLGVGTDCLHVLLAAAVTDSEDGTPSITTHPHGLFPNLRTGLDVACAAAWLLGEPDRRLRVRARIILHVREMAKEAAAHDAMVADMTARNMASRISPEATAAKQHADAWGAQRAGELNLPRMHPKQWPETGSIVTRGADLAGFGGTHASLLWRSLSGATHGAWWATSLLGKDIVRDVPEGPTVEARLTLSVTVLTALMWDVTHILDYGWATFDRRRKAPSIS